ncbi:MAG TPA: hypothetical protein VG408_02950 [Actinomycetota bacterium]|nr:hypothetical protein [Actinomycetota bacterium]
MIKLENDRVAFPTVHARVRFEEGEQHLAAFKKRFVLPLLRLI